MEVRTGWLVSSSYAKPVDSDQNGVETDEFVGGLVSEGRLGESEGDRGMVVVEAEGIVKRVFQHDSRRGVGFVSRCVERSVRDIHGRVRVV